MITHATSYDFLQAFVLQITVNRLANDNVTDYKDHDAKEYHNGKIDWQVALTG